MGLQTYRAKRSFDKTPEPAGRQARRRKTGLRYLVQHHAARRDHYDFRLELDGVLKSWAVPKGPSLDPKNKALAVHVEDHPLDYAEFEGVIPQGQYGGGTVMLWDQGTWDPEGDPQRSYRRGRLKFRLHGEKLEGAWSLVRMRNKGERGENWLLIKSNDEHAHPVDEYDVLSDQPVSVASGRTMQQIAKQADRVWTSEGEVEPEQGEVQAAPAADVEEELEEVASGRARPLPRKFQPLLASLAKETPTGDEWLHELKFDGYRILCRLEKGKARLITRRGIDWTDRFPTVARAALALGVDDTILDGEVVVMAADGTTDFQALQNVMNRGRDDDVVYFAFDMPYCRGHALTEVPLIERKRLLKTLLAEQPPEGVIRYSDHIQGGGEKVFQHACRHALEGVVSKRANSLYQQRRSRDWVKSKCLNRQEFVVVGWTRPSGSRQGFGSLLLGYYEQDKLVYCGRVGTGFNAQSLRDVKQRLDELARDASPLHRTPKRPETRSAHWVEPRLVAEVEFRGWTGDGLLRQAAFQGLREDKVPEEVVREGPATSAERQPPKRTGSRAASSRSKKPSSAGSNGRAAKGGAAKGRAAKGGKIEVAGVQLSSPDRVLYPQQGISKQELAQFYEAIADWVLPYMVQRPLTLVRCPKGREGECFYQKHLTEAMPDQLKGVEVPEKNQRRTYALIEDVSGLVSLVQMSVLEVHPWPARADRLDRPDMLVFDLDPAEDVKWQQVIDAAVDVRERLQAVGLESFVRTSGGKGLHVVAPIARRTDWDLFKAFARAIADSLVQDYPDHYIATASKARRHGKVFIDYLRNQRGATSIASYSTRARPGAPVATPLRWDELNARLKPDKYTVRNLRNRLTSLSSDPWEGFFDLKQSIPKSIIAS